MKDFPRISDSQLQRTRSQVQFVGRDDTGKLQFLETHGLDLHRDDVLVIDRYRRQADELTHLRDFPLVLPVYGIGVKATAAEIYAQVLSPMDGRFSLTDDEARRLCAVEIIQERFGERTSDTRMTFKMRLYRRKRGGE